MTKPILEVTNLTITLSNNFFLRKKTIINNISFTIWPNECIGIMGPNGSGKTTLLKTLCGLIIKKKGTINIKKKYIGYVPERYQGPPFLTAKQYMFYLGKLSGIQDTTLHTKIDHLFSLFHLHTYANNQIKNLSNGTAQRLYIAQAMLSNPRILILDEPLSGLDYRSIEQLKQYIKYISTNGTAIICATHTIEPNYFDRIIYI